MVRALLVIAASIATLYLAGGAYLFAKQRAFLYPVHLIGERVGPPRAPFASVEIATPDGERLRGWHAPARDGFPTILMLHGNGDTLEGLAPRLHALAELGHGVLAFAFRGYPGSTGSPSEEGLTRDAFAAFDWLIAHGVAEHRIAPFGRSLGSGLAVKLATERRPGALILEAAYTSIVAVAQRQFPIYPAALLLRDPYRSLDRIGEVRAPLLIVHGRDDALIPFAMSRTLHERAGSAMKTIAIVDGAGHNDLDGYGLVPLVDAFLRALEPSTTAVGGGHGVR